MASRSNLSDRTDNAKDDGGIMKWASDLMKGARGSQREEGAMEARCKAEPNSPECKRYLEGKQKQPAE